MTIRKFKPYTHSMRFTETNAHSEVTKRAPEKSLVFGHSKTGARNNQGATTMWTKGGGHKRRLRVIDFRRGDKAGVPAVVAAIQYDPNRTAHLALLHYKDGEKRYVLAPAGLEVGTEVFTGSGVELKVGNCLPLAEVPVGAIVHSIELKPGKGAQLVRGAGTGAQIMGKDDKQVLVRLPSSVMRYVPAVALATMGQVGNLDHSNQTGGKAGRTRWKGRKPIVRATAMNPIDHPMGGGEGRGKGNHPMTPWGRPSKGYKTRQRRKPTNRFIVRRKNNQVLR